MLLRKLCLLISTSLFFLPVTAQERPVPAIVPQPVSVQWQPAKRDFLLGRNTTIVYGPALEPQAVYLRDEIKKQCGLDLLVRAYQAETQNVIILLLDKDQVTVSKPEAYNLDVNQNNTGILAIDKKGIVNGIQTFLQLLPLENRDKVQVPGVLINDHPRFTYRGMHLDVVRHFFPPEYIRKYIDYLAFHKFNTFHWHLTDDQGWRVEMLSYPRLNTIGSWREATLIGHFNDAPIRYDSTRYGGFYTRQEIRELIAYADVRGITIIPEIDIPGHSRAIIAAYPELSTRPDTTWPVAITWGMYNRQNNVLAPRPATFQFLKTVFGEIADLFPAPYVHLGGDECSKIWWKSDPATQAFMKQQGLKDEAALQTYFIREVAGYLKVKGKTVIGWHEIMEGELEKSTVVMNWANDKTAIKAASKGYPVIMTPEVPMYFNHYPTRNNRDSLAARGLTTLQMVYQYDPIPKDLPADRHALILGGQGNVWTEYIAYPTKVDYMIFPRMTALSEVLWSPKEKRDFTDFLRRAERSMLPRYQFWESHFLPLDRWVE
jgi:hexosaminidase